MKEVEIPCLNVNGTRTEKGTAPLPIGAVPFLSFTNFTIYYEDSDIYIDKKAIYYANTFSCLLSMIRTAFPSDLGILFGGSTLTFILTKQWFFIEC